MGGYYSPSPGDVITAANFKTYVRDQVVNQFASASARDSAITSPTEGVYADLADTDSLTRYNGSSWDTIASAGAWTDFSSSFVIGVTGGTAPVKGNSTYFAGYKQVGKVVTFGFHCILGSTFSPGAGTWSFLVPVTAGANNAIHTGAAYVLDTGTRVCTGTVYFGDTTHLVMLLANISGAPVDSGGPGTTWATGDIIKAQITYEAA